MNRPLLLLDVDGPLNPWKAKPTRRPDGYTTHRLNPRGFDNPHKPLRVWLNPDHGRMLLEAAAVADAELAWANHVGGRGEHAHRPDRRAA